MTVATARRPKVFTAEEPVFKTGPLFVVGMPWDQFARMMKRRFNADVGLDAGQLGTMLTYERAPWRVVWSRTHDLGVVLHETFHLVTRVCHDKGIPIKALTADGNGDEAAAYLFEHYARAVLRRCR